MSPTADPAHPGVADLLASSRLLPVLQVDAAVATRLGHALREGGLDVAEVTLRSPDAEGALRAMAEVDGLCVGAGTVLVADQVDRAVDAGARFVVSPGLDTDVVRRCRELGTPVFPGVATPTELMHAAALGLDVVKLFPAATLGGPDAVAALAGPFPRIRFVPTGGISADAAAAYLAHPSVLAVGGSFMAPAELVAAADWAAIAAHVAHVLRAVHGAPDGEGAR
ncbi:MAG: bifunctional 4-hydroxy-2-oxoglutarate aldolase/2-dehydro-3-deoxy-phosphogluconate aldolase [Nocardioidaceae bacterium]